MRCIVGSIVLAGSVLMAAGCADRPELSPSAYGTVLEELPVLSEAEKPFPFPVQGGDDHKNCVFNEMDFM